MIIQEIYLDKYDWDVLIYYAVDTYFSKEILTNLKLMNCPREVYESAKDILVNFKTNRGFTYSNGDNRCSIIIIGLTTSADEFQSTFDHEKGHLAMHICLTLNINPFSEEYQYLTGDIGKQMFPVAKKFLCECCRKQLINNLTERAS